MNDNRRRRTRGEEHGARPNYRHARLSHLITEVVDAIVRDELTDPAVDGVLLTGTQLSPDGHHLFAWFTSPDAPSASAALARAAPLIRTRLADRLGLDRIPQLHFAPDPRDAFTPGGDPCLG